MKGGEIGPFSQNVADLFVLFFVAVVINCFIGYQLAFCLHSYHIRDVRFLLHDALWSVIYVSDGGVYVQCTFRPMRRDKTNFYWCCNKECFHYME